MKKVLIIDPDKCTGCETCTFICSAVHSGVFNPYYSRIKTIRVEPIINCAISCQFCEDAPCAAVCPWDAIEKDEDTGIVRVNEDKCVGCGFCIRACNFGAISMSLVDDLVFICDQCEEFEDGPQCVKFCPEDAITFEPLESESDRKRREATQRLLVEAVKG